MKIRLVPLGMALSIARARRDYLHKPRELPWAILLCHVPAEWFSEDCYLDVDDIDDYGHFQVINKETGENYSIPAWMVSDIVNCRRCK